MARELPRVPRQLQKVFGGGFSHFKGPINQRRFSSQNQAELAVYF